MLQNGQAHSANFVARCFRIFKVCLIILKHAFKCCTDMLLVALILIHKSLHYYDLCVRDFRHLKVPQGKL